MKKALAVICYARWDYLELTLASILNQRVGGKPLEEVYDIFVFQDGLWAGEGEANRAGHAKIRKAMPTQPGIRGFVSQETNLGVAFHFDFIERDLFLRHEYDFAIFCEDDLILAPGYAATLDAMAARFEDDPRIGMLSAHPDHCTRPHDEQERGAGRYAVIGHNWGFGLYRKFWLRRQAFVDLYLGLIANAPYRQRPTPAVLEWLRRIGLHPAGSSQDYMKDCATYTLGAVKLATFVNLGLPIGRVGLHSTEEHFRQSGLDSAVVFDRAPETLPGLGDEEFAALYEDGARLIGGEFARSIRDPSRAYLNDWQARLRAGDFHPGRVLGGAS